MNAREFKTIYEEMLFDWELECTSDEITPLPESKLQKFINFQKEIHQIEHHAPPPDAPENVISIIWELKKASSQNVDYIIEDLLAIRKEKIVELCKNLEIIEQKDLTLSEQQFYQNISSAFKGYNKNQQYHNALAESCPEEDISKPLEVPCDPVLEPTVAKIEYCDVRVLKFAEALVGPDFVTYGPFNKEDLVRLPKRSARIMEKEKIVEILE